MVGINHHTWVVYHCYIRIIPFRHLLFNVAMMVSGMPEQHYVGFSRTDISAAKKKLLVGWKHSTCSCQKMIRSPWCSICWPQGCRDQGITRVENPGSVMLPSGNDFWTWPFWVGKSTISGHFQVRKLLSITRGWSSCQTRKNCKHIVELIIQSSWLIRHGDPFHSLWFGDLNTLEWSCLSITNHCTILTKWHVGSVEHWIEWMMNLFQEHWKGKSTFDTFWNRVFSP